MTIRALVGAVVGLATTLHGCVESRCYEAVDCEAPKLCDPTGRCVYECTTAADCGEGFACVNHRCEVKNQPPIKCPADMVAVAGSFCIDRYEASRPDASAVNPGSDRAAAMSVKGVLPWQVESNAAAEDACTAVGKRLCSVAEWTLACTGPNSTVYAYGDKYQAEICNGIDTFGSSDFHLLPTGSLAQCTNEWGIFDINGNLWEHVSGGSDAMVRGGAYNCGDSARLHRCDYVPGSWTPSARGFRCCASHAEQAWGTDIGTPSTDDSASDTGSGSGCIDETINESVTGSTENTDVATGSATVDTGSATVDTGSITAGTGSVTVDTESDSVAACPPDMVAVADFCIDVYEAARSDATAAQGGVSTTAVAKAGVIPWYSVTLAQARAGCASMNKRLCRPDEWIEACGGPSATAYAYGDDYDPQVCNGIDTFCRCDSGSCASLQVCPYPHCYNQVSSTESGGPCGAGFHVMPTRSFTRCTNVLGLFDVNGNVWEIVDSTDGLEHFRGGAYNCSDSEALHRCDYDATWGPSARGFRCCREQERR